MSLDVSPDGRTLVFDLLGDLYTLPIAGGRATLLLGGPAYEMHPRFSPDGRRIAFTSDRDGLPELWTMAAGGGDLRQISKEREREVSNPAWTPDGQYLVARKHFRNTRSMGAGEMWLYHIAGGGGSNSPTAETGSRTPPSRSSPPTGATSISPKTSLPEAASSTTAIRTASSTWCSGWTGRPAQRVTWLTVARAGSLAPQLSPDGRTMAFIRRVGRKSVLFVHDMESGQERPLWDGLDHDQQEAWAIFGTYPGYDWTPDGKRS